MGSSPFSFRVLCDIQHCGPSLSASVSSCMPKCSWRVLSLHAQMQLCLRCWPGPARPTLPSSHPGLVCRTMTHKHASQRRPLPEFHTTTQRPASVTRNTEDLLGAGPALGTTGDGCTGGNARDVQEGQAALAGAPQEGSTEKLALLERQRRKPALPSHGEVSTLYHITLGERTDILGHLLVKLVLCIPHWMKTSRKTFSKQSSCGGEEGWHLVPPSLNDRDLPLGQIPKTTRNQAKQGLPFSSRKYIRFAILWGKE